MGPVRVGPQDRISPNESRQATAHRPSSAPEPGDHAGGVGGTDDGHPGEIQSDSGAGDSRHSGDEDEPKDEYRSAAGADDDSADDRYDNDDAADDQAEEPESAAAGHDASGDEDKDDEDKDGKTAEDKTTEGNGKAADGKAADGNAATGKGDQPEDAPAPELADEFDLAEDQDERLLGQFPVSAAWAASFDENPVAGSRSAHDGQPSWSGVIATTLRLWLQRRVLGRPDVPGQRRKAAGRRVGVFGVVFLIFAAGALTVALAQHRTSSPHGSGASATKVQAAQPTTAALAQAATNRENAAAWVAAQVSTSVIVSCDPLMCADLQAHHFPVGDLMSLGPSATDPMGSQIIMSTTALRSQFGKRLADVYAPVVIATFGSGATRVDVRIDAPQGSRAYLVAQHADLLARQASGKQLLHNKFLHAAGASQQDMAAGRVDSRLLITLAALAAQLHQVYIARFGDAGPDPLSAPLRMVRIAALIPREPGKPRTYLNEVLRFLRTQQSPFRSSVSVLTEPGKTLVQIQFAAPSPLGLLGANATP